MRKVLFVACVVAALGIGFAPVGSTSEFHGEEVALEHGHGGWGGGHRGGGRGWGHGGGRGWNNGDSGNGGGGYGYGYHRGGRW